MSDVRACANECGRSFVPPRKDPERVMCDHCLKDLGLPRTNTPAPEAPLPTAACSECGAEFVKTDAETRCSVCKNLVHTDEDAGAPAYLSVLEVDERPAAVTDVPLHKRLSKKDCLEYAAELAADMETGYYIPPGAKEPWAPRRFNIREILGRMGYGEWYVANNRRPSWWPEGGTQAFKGYVEWKVRERAMLGRVTYDKLVPYIEALTFMGFAEMARRIKLDPEHVPFRDLSQFTMRGVEVIKGQADPWKGDTMTVDGADAYQRMSKAIDGVGDDVAKKAITAMLDAVLVEARDRMREVVRVPARAG